MKNPSKRSMSESSLRLADPFTQGAKAARSACLQKDSPSEKDTQGEIAKPPLEHHHDIFGPRKSEIQASLHSYITLERKCEEIRRMLLNLIKEQRLSSVKELYISEYEKVLNKLDRIYRQYDRREEKWRKDYERLHSHNQDYFCPYQLNTMSMAKVNARTKPSEAALDWS